MRNRINDWHTDRYESLPPNMVTKVLDYKTINGRK